MYLVWLYLFENLLMQVCNYATILQLSDEIYPLIFFLFCFLFILVLFIVFILFCFFFFIPMRLFYSMFMIEYCFIKYFFVIVLIFCRKYKKNVMILFFHTPKNAIHSSENKQTVMIWFFLILPYRRREWYFTRNRPWKKKEKCKNEFGHKMKSNIATKSNGRR